MADIIITHKRDVAVFSGVTPKGEEFIQIYTVLDTMKVESKLLSMFKLEAERLGLVIEVIT